MSEGGAVILTPPLYKIFTAFIAIVRLFCVFFVRIALILAIIRA